MRSRDRRPHLTTCKFFPRMASNQYLVQHNTMGPEVTKSRKRNGLESDLAKLLARRRDNWKSEITITVTKQMISQWWLIWTKTKCSLSLWLNSRTRSWLQVVRCQLAYTSVQLRLKKSTSSHGRAIPHRSPCNLHIASFPAKRKRIRIIRVLRTLLRFPTAWGKTMRWCRSRIMIISFSTTIKSEVRANKQ
jgi:hypothetical protein